jgi:putative membrane protein
MRDLILTILLNGVALFLAAYILKPRVQVRGILTAIITAAVLALLNATVGSILKALTLPLSIVTLSLFTFVIDALIILLADYFLKGFKVKGFIWALVLAVVLSLFNGILQHFFF